MTFSREELEAIRRADEEIESSFRITSQEIAESRNRDFAFSLSQNDERKANERRKKKEWYESNREKVLSQKKRYYQENRERILAYQRDYYRRVVIE